MNHYNESKRIEFEIRKEAFLSHKISGLEPYTIYVGKNNFLTKMLETVEQIKGVNAPYTAIMDTYAMYEGVMIAKESTTILNGVKQNYKVIHYKLNAPIDDSEFTPPQLD
jgi:hypothetical protein